MTLDFSGQRVLVTGASSGIGAALAERFASLGAVVGICARREDRLGEVLERCRAHTPESRMWVSDFADPAQVDGLAKAALAELGGVDVLVNNAGIPKRRQVTALDPETVEHVMQVNYFSAARLTLALLPSMLERGSGRLVHVSSIAAKLAPPGESAYSASKAALTAFAEGLAVDVWDRGVTTTIVYPGIVDTDLFHLPDNDPPPPGLDAITVEEFVDELMAGLEQDALEVYVPAWFLDVAKGKANDVAGFLAGTVAWLREQASSA